MPPFRIAAVAAVMLLAVSGVTSAAGYRVETVAEGLEHPWSLAWLPDGRLLVTERPGRLRLIEDGKLRAEPVAGVPAAHTGGQAGLFDVLPAPDFAQSKLLYLSLAHGNARANTLAVVRGRLDGGRLIDVEEVFRARPLRNTSVHYGGRMVFLADGSLLITVGDAYNFREEAQRLGNHFGTTVRIRPDGSVPDDNPFIDRDDALPEIWSYGHRNPQGLVYDAVGDTIWLHEHGPRGGDELNRIEASGNYGWPIATHGIDYSGARISPYTELPGTRAAAAVWTPSIAPAGMTLYRGDLFPQWHGDLFVAALAEKSVRRLRLKNGEVVEQQRLFDTLGKRLRDVRSGPDGALYLLTDHTDGAVLRVVPSEN